MSIQQTISPVDGRVYVERTHATGDQIAQLLNKATAAQKSWAAVPLDDRRAIVAKFVEAMLADADAIGEELTWQMGRPIRYTPNEIRRGFAERARFGIDAAPGALADIAVPAQPGFNRFIRKTPVGVVLTIAPWNYPYLAAVNSVVPAVLAGNAVILKHSSQTPLCAERIAAGFQSAGLPDGVFNVLQASHSDVEKMIGSGQIAFVSFTGSVEGGRKIQAAANGVFIGMNLELGGKDPAYVREDANLADAIENLVDGAMFNSGQCCCGIERIYVHRSQYDAFVKGAVELTRTYKLDNPLDAATTLGPMVKTSAAEFVRAQIAEAVAQGAAAHIDPREFPRDAANTPYLAPQILTNVNHSMRVMMEETFGPVVGIMPVDSDEEAIRLMNDSPYGLTAGVWTHDEAAALAISAQLETGTCFMNRCDYLDPYLAWTGVKDTGRGCSLSVLGFDALTRPKSFHLRAV
ncbi:MAG TPA: aldehyde dehydrogenase family protein [Bryobacteraceae bacterium]|nr:aldehyde dehydrogenase family protein [Bryobacteraceae bacterium]